MLQIFRQKAEPNILPAVKAALGVFCFVVTLTFNTQQSDANYIPTTTLQQERPTQVNLFGANEERYTDLSAFTKWNGVLNRFKADLMSSLDQKPVQDWLVFLDTLKGQSKTQQIDAVNHYLNQIRFVSDNNNYGQNDYWATPVEFLAKGGDCEDYAVAKYISLRALGFSKDELRLVIVNDKIMRAPHAMLAVYEDGKANILDNQNPAVMNSAQITRYAPVYSISQASWWRHA